MGPCCFTSHACFSSPSRINILMETHCDHGTQIASRLLLRVTLLHNSIRRELMNPSPWRGRERDNDQFKASGHPAFSRARTKPRTHTCRFNPFALYLFDANIYPSRLCKCSKALIQCLLCGAYCFVYPCLTVTFYGFWQSTFAWLLSCH